ncbi:MAG: cobalamin-binding protein, partial [Chloroflexi bacterium]|nr:cobalamin-binding protein [Chloroflexota bacterium]
EARDTRYPRVTIAEIKAAQPEIILLPSEPFGFDITHKLSMIELLAGTPAVKKDRVLLVDGSLLTWHGTHLAKAINELPSLLTF